MQYLQLCMSHDAELLLHTTDGFSLVNLPFNLISSTANTKLHNKSLHLSYPQCNSDKLNYSSFVLCANNLKQQLSSPDHLILFYALLADESIEFSKCYFQLKWKHRAILMDTLFLLLHTVSHIYQLGSTSPLCIQYSACIPPCRWLNMWLIQHHESIELHKSHADLFKLQNQLCKTAEEVYNRYCQDGARRRMDLLPLSLLVFCTISSLFDTHPLLSLSHFGSHLTANSLSLNLVYKQPLGHSCRQDKTHAPSHKLIWHFISPLMRRVSLLTHGVAPLHKSWSLAFFSDASSSAYWLCWYLKVVPDVWSNLKLKPEKWSGLLWH